MSRSLAPGTTWQPPRPSCQRAVLYVHLDSSGCAFLVATCAILVRPRIVNAYSSVITGKFWVCLVYSVCSMWLQSENHQKISAMIHNKMNVFHVMHETLFTVSKSTVQHTVCMHLYMKCLSPVIQMNTVHYTHCNSMRLWKCWRAWLAEGISPGS